MKLCCKCNTEKSKKEFHKNKTKFDGLQSHCKQCVKEHHASWYQQNKKRVMKHTLNRRQRLYQTIDEIKKRSRCIICGEAETVCLDFHHLGEHKKERNISDMVQYGPSWDSLQQEIDKCIVVCSNCHRKIHGGLIDTGTLA